jgi:hypothetical protein
MERASQVIDERKQIRIGELLMDAGIVASEYIKNALQNFEQRGLPIGKVLVMSGYLTEQQLRTALEVQSLINDGLLPVDVAINVLQIAHRDKVPLAEAFQNSGFVQPEDQQTNKLGQLLVGAGIVNAKDLEEALQTNIRTGLPLGHIFCFRGGVSQSLIWTGLLAQQLIRKGMISREMAIQALKDAREREVVLEKLPVNRGYQRQPMKPTPKMGELMMQAFLINETQLNDALHRTLLTRRFTGEVLVDQSMTKPYMIAAVIDLQEMMDNGTLTQALAKEALVIMRANDVPLRVAVAEVGAYKPRANKAVKLLELLTSSGSVALTGLPNEVQECVQVNYNQARQMVKLLLENKLATEEMIYGGLRCVYLIDENILDMQKAIMALDFASRANLSVDDALLELGWTLRTRLRSL